MTDPTRKHTATNVGNTAAVLRGRTPLPERYGPADLRVLSPAEVARYTGGDATAEDVDMLPWELLYRLEPELYSRLVAAERLHPDIIAWLPKNQARAVEIGAGTGRLTVELAPRCRELTAVEPVAELRAVLERRLSALGPANAAVVAGDFHALPVANLWADLVIACSALTPHHAHGGEAGLHEMERVCAPGGRVAIVWPTHPEWLISHGYRYLAFEGPMAMEFESLSEAVELASIFFPHAVDRILAAGRSSVPYELIGAPRPCDVAWKEMPD